MSEDQQAPRPTATLVGRSFVKLYYTHLSEDPNNLHRFYKDESVLSHGVEGQESEIEEVYGQKNIHQKILSMDYKKSKASLSLVDCQLSLNGGVVVSVVGQLFNESQSPVVARRFLQVFFLAVQPSSNTSGGVGYFVLNDIFRFLKEPTVVVTTVSTPMANANPTPVLTTPLPASTPAIPVSTETTHQTSAPVKAHAHDHKQNQHQHRGSHYAQSHSNEKHTEPQVTTATQPNNVVSSPPVVVLAPQQQQQAPPQQTPQAVSGKKQNLPPVTIELINPEELTPKTWAHLVGGPAYMEHIRTKVDTTKTVQLPNNNDDDETMSDLKLYVSNIPYMSTRQALESEFKKYGPIRYINWKNNRGYAFVEYDTEEGVNAVIKHIEKDPIVLEGRTLRIERKKTTRLTQNNGKGINRQGFKRNERRSQSFGGSQQRYNSPNNTNNNTNNANNNANNAANNANNNANNSANNNAANNTSNSANSPNNTSTSTNNVTHSQQASNNNTKENKDGQNSNKQQRPKGTNSQIKPQNKTGAINKRTASSVN
jgi:hypothetical protein